MVIYTMEYYSAINRNKMDTCDHMDDSQALYGK